MAKNLKEISINAARCGICEDYIESKHRHDFVTCSCGNLAVDGGQEYLKRSFKQDNWVDMSQMTRYGHLKEQASNLQIQMDVAKQEILQLQDDHDNAVKKLRNQIDRANMEYLSILSEIKTLEEA